MSEKIIITMFTDPMMGLHYESEPIIDRLQKEYADKIEFRYIMSLLVRDVSQFMLPEERAIEPTEGIRQYCKRLAGIYKSEEAIGGLPINMDGFCLFDPEHRSSRPLCLAYKAAQLTAPDKADSFLAALRHATVQDCRPTTHDEEILKVVQDTGIDENAFLRFFKDGSAGAALDQDISFTRSMGIHSLPTYLIQCGDKALLMQSFDYLDFITAISKVTGAQ